MTITSKPQSETPREFKVLGTRPIRHDGLEKVTGRAKYAADVNLVGLLHGKRGDRPVLCMARHHSLR